MMNVMHNIAQIHDNDRFIINYLGVDHQILITDCNYTPKTLIAYINPLISVYNVVMTYNATSNYFTFTSTVIGTIIKPQNMKSILGMTGNLVLDVINFPIVANNNYIDYFISYANMLNYTKIIVSTSLNYHQNPQTNFKSSYLSTSGINNILFWVSKDVAGFTTINYTNNDSKNELILADTNIGNITFTLHNEYLELLKNASRCYIHFQIIKETKNDYMEMIYNQIKDISFILLNIWDIIFKGTNKKLKSQLIVE